MIYHDREVRIDYLETLLSLYYPLHFFALFRAHELYSVEPFIKVLSAPVLDLGCGDGLIANLLFESSLDYGIDRSRSAVQQAKGNGVYKTVFHGNGHTLPFKDSSVGGVFSNCVLEHIPDMPGLIQEIARVLRPGSYFVATCLSPFYYTHNPVFKIFDKPLLRWFRRNMIAQENKLHNHVSVFSIQEYRQMFGYHNMVVEKHKYYATRTVAEICSTWDTASKYVIPLPLGLRHKGLLIRYLQLKYRLFAQKDVMVKKWYNELYEICYNRNDDDQIGVGQILVVRKLNNR